MFTSAGSFLQKLKLQFCNENKYVFFGACNYRISSSIFENVFTELFLTFWSMYLQIAF